MRIIITGGTGLIGKPLSASYAQEGHEVIVLTRSPEKHRAALPDGVSAAGWDGRSAEGWGQLADGADAIINLAGENLSAGRWTERRKGRILTSRTNAGQAVVAAVRAAKIKPKVVIQMSGVDYYGSGDQPVSEASPAGSSFLSRVCVAWEAASRPVEEMGVRRVVVRNSVVLSTRGGVLPLFLLPFRLFVGGPMGGGEQWLSWIHIADEVAAIRYFVENEQARGVYNLSSPHPVTNSEFGKVLGKVLHRPSLIPAPAFMFRLALGEMSSLVLNGTRVVSQRLLDAHFPYRFPQAESALRNLVQSGE